MRSVALATVRALGTALAVGLTTNDPPEPNDPIPSGYDGYRGRGR